MLDENSLKAAGGEFLHVARGDDLFGVIVGHTEEVV